MIFEGGEVFEIDTVDRSYAARFLVPGPQLMPVIFTFVTTFFSLKTIAIYIQLRT